MLLNFLRKKLYSDNIHAKIKEGLICEFLNSLSSGESVLDIGAGEMPYKKYCGHLNYKSQDFCLYDGKGDNKGVQTGNFNIDRVDIRSDIEDIPVPSESFDNIICTEVLEHTINPVAAIKEMCRILKVGGKIIITVPGTSFLHFSPYHYYAGFKVNFFIRIFSERNIQVKDISRVGNIFSLLSLYLWFAISVLASMIFKGKLKSLFLSLSILICSPIFITLNGMGKVNIHDDELIEAGIVAIGIKK